MIVNSKAPNIFEEFDSSYLLGAVKDSEYFVKAPYQIKILGNAVVTPSVKKKQQQAPATPVAPVVPTNTATKGV